MVNFSNSEFTDMHFIYGECHGNACAARRLYSERYPERRAPNEKTFIDVHRRLREGGMFKKNNARGRHVTMTPQQEENILDFVQRNPRESIRRTALRFRLSSSSVGRFLKKQNLHPYHMQKVQELLPGDLHKRVAFCQTMINYHENNPQFCRQILFTDEATFNRGIFNIHNEHVWSEENPHAMQAARFQHNFSLNVWAGIIGNRLIGPIFLPRLDARVYLDFLEDQLPEILEDVPLDVRQEMWYMHDGAPAHSAGVVQELLNRRYPHRWIDRNAPLDFT